MLRIIFLFLLAFVGISVSAQQIFTVTNSGSQFNPSLINAKIGDSITFSLSSSHPVLQVDETTYNSNGKTALPGGFSFPDGIGTYIATDAGTVYFVCTNHVSSGMKGKIVISLSTGLHNLSLNPEFEIYPNPAKDYLYIKSQGGSKPLAISIFNMAGKKLYQTGIQNPENNKIPVLVEDLRKGMYFISVTYPDKTNTRKFIKL